MISFFPSILAILNFLIIRLRPSLKALQLSHTPQGSVKELLQLNAIAHNSAIELLPVPLGPVKRLNLGKVPDSRACCITGFK